MKKKIDEFLEVDSDEEFSDNDDDDLSDTGVIGVANLPINVVAALRSIGVWTLRLCDTLVFTSGGIPTIPGSGRMVLL